MSAAAKTSTPKKTASTKASTKSSIDFSAIDLLAASDVVNWMQDVGLEELEIEQSDVKIRLKRPSVGVAMASAPALAPVAAALAPAAEAAPAAQKEENFFKSPIVGTFYRSPSPEASAFVKEGDVVKEGQTLCIVEAMKTMNQVEADRAGTVTKILATDAQPVEFGEPLFVIE